MLKTLSKREFFKLCDILKDYINHLQHNPDSLLIKFLGMYQMEWKDPETKKPRTYNMLVMSNLFKSFQVGQRFDLKGSIASRTRLTVNDSFEDPSRDETIALKDNDFRKYMKQINFVEQMKPDMPPLLDVIRNDSEFLKRSNLIDYSLLLGELKIELSSLREMCKKNPELGRGIYIDGTKRAWLIGIIDPLNSYTTVKKAENLFKSTGYGNSLSAVPPQFYSDRFIGFFNGIFNFEE